MNDQTVKVTAPSTYQVNAGLTIGEPDIKFHPKVIAIHVATSGEYEIAIDISKHNTKR